MFSFCPLQGALSDSSASQSLLELDGGVKILIDVGWDETFEAEKLKELGRIAPTLSLILLTHATVPHLAAYAHCCKHFPPFQRIPVYATRPVIDLGRTLTQDLYASTPLAATTISSTSLAQVSYASGYAQAASADNTFLLQPPTPDEITKYFSLIQPLKYSQPHQPLPSPFSPPLNGLTITAYNSGHTLGGTIWHIQHGLESIVYAVDWNHSRENVFAGAAWLGGNHGGARGTQVIEQLHKPTALVCSSRTPDASLSRLKRDEQLMESIKLCIARGGTVLIPVDSSARVLELSYLLEHAWRKEVAKDNDVFKSAKLFLAGRTISSTMKNARSMLEWMDDNIIKEFEAFADESRRNNRRDEGNHQTGPGPFDFKHLRLLERKAQIDKILEQSEDAEPRAKVILASDASLDWGFSKDVLKSIAADARNLVILTEKPNFDPNHKPSIARTLWEWWKERRDGVATERTSNGDTFEQVYAGNRELEIKTAERKGLEGDELNVYQQWLATQRQLQATLQSGGTTTLEAPGDVLDDADTDTDTDSEGSDTEQQGKALNIATTMAQASRKKVALKDEDLGVTILIKKENTYDFNVRGKKGRDRMFPVAMRRRRADEFGELIRPEDYLRAEEREDAENAEAGQVNNSTQELEGLGKKRKWEDVGTAGRGRGGSGPNKRSHHNDRRRLSAGEADAAPFSENGPADDDLSDLEDEEDDTLKGPAKLVVTKETIPVRLRIAFVDFSGLHDKRSLTMLIPLIQPRKLVLIAGGKDETLALAADVKKLLTAQSTGTESAIEVLTPEVGTTVDASVDTNAWVLKLADPLVKGLKWQNVRGLGIVTVTGLLLPGGEFQHTEDGDAAKRQKLEDGSTAASETPASTAALVKAGTNTSPTITTTATASLPTLDLVPPTLASSLSVRSQAAQPLHVGELRLADLRRAMLSAGHKVEFKGEGTLLIDDVVVVRKSTAQGGRVELESVGLPSDTMPGTTSGGLLDAAMRVGGTFYAVRKKIYEGLAVVAGA
ncbi:beta-lactamase-like protein [Pseudoneurospora amorphoporcata]|uniref:Cleavage and polyadenylation specificity factor subunit 2 n=1 Tax=Pseudoneurospora amorphoporcata TaxID=241081 RepID=A0AAN6NQ21_9PEZI|nr:beta-lactamase-like protein [Pseudoneurospora amorphoporcata]